MEPTALRAEIKSWERAFRVDNHRDPSINDIKAYPNIAAKYRLYKKLSKDCSSSTAQKSLSTEAPSTPRRSSLSPVNPFSPAKARIKPGASNNAPLNQPQVAELLTTPPNRKRIYSTPSPEPLPAAGLFMTAAHLLDDAPADSSAIRKARKRLRGDAVSPSPSRSGKKQRAIACFSTDLQPFLTENKITNPEDDEADMSYVDESPVKPISNRKDFKLLFDEERLPRFDLMGNNPQSSVSLTGQKRLRNGDELLQVVSDKEQKPIKMNKSQKQEKALHLLKKAGSSKANPWIPIAAGKTPCSAIDALSRNSFSDIEGDLYRTSREHSSLEETSGLPSDTPTSVIFASELLPPSPPPSTTGTMQGAGTTGTNRNRKKQKLLMDTKVDDDSLEEQSDIHVVEFDPRSLRKLNVYTVNSDEVDEAERDVFQVVRASYCDGDNPIIGEVAPHGTELEVSLPEDLRKILYISSSCARDREERALVDSLLHGASDSRNQRGEVWGVGEAEDAASAITDYEDDWAGEGVPWEAGEL
ncbi:hypothetical protein M0805_000965 [Coniferiporia weirii]|nr:hypothetical protein M0805_000965 [Coniferiporia weirii]